jgi:hypothetical protein
MILENRCPNCGSNGEDRGEYDPRGSGTYYLFCPNCGDNFDDNIGPKYPRFQIRALRLLSREWDKSTKSMRNPKLNTPEQQALENAHILIDHLLALFPVRVSLKVEADPHEVDIIRE